MADITKQLADALRKLEQWVSEAADEDGASFDWHAINADEGAQARAALAAHDAEQAAQAVPAGFVLVPVEFIEAGQRIAQEYARTNPKWPMWANGEAEPKVQDPCGAHAWLERAAMLAAAPTPPAPEAQRKEPLIDEQLFTLLKEARKIIRASSSRSLAKDWDRRATQALAGATTGEQHG